MSNWGRDDRRNSEWSEYAAALLAENDPVEPKWWRYMDAVLSLVVALAVVYGIFVVIPQLLTLARARGDL